MTKNLAIVLAVFAILLSLTGPAEAALTPVATYLFQNSLNAQQGGVPALVATDPEGASSYGTATVFGQNRTVYNFGGNASPPTQQGGLSFDNSGALIANNNYSVEMVFEFTQNPNAWRRILDVQNRQSDNGFYVDPNNNLDIFPVTGAGPFSNNVFYDVILTDSNSGTVNAYLNGALQFSATTTVMNINNPQNLVNFFLDNVVGGGQGEYSDGQIALIRMYNGVLPADQAATLGSNPFGGSPAVPEPSSLLVWSLLGAICVWVRKRAWKPGGSKLAGS